MSKIDTKNGNALKNERSPALHVPYTNHLDHNTVRLKSGHVCQVIRLDGVSFETAGDNTLENLHKTRQQLLRTIADGRITVWTNIVRRQIHQFPSGDFEDKFSGDLNNRYKDFTLQGQKLFINELYLTILYKDVVQAPPVIRTMVESAKAAFGGTVAGLSKSARKAKTRQQIKAVTDKVQETIGFLGRFEPKVLGTYEKDGILYSEVFEFFGQLINGRYEPMPLLRKEAAKYLSSNRHFFGKDTAEVKGINFKRLFAAIGLQEYPADTQYHRLNGLLELPCEFTLSQSFSFVPRQEAVAAMQLIADRMEQAGDLAESQIEEIHASLDDLVSNRICMGNHHLNLIVYGEGQKVLEEHLSKAIGVIGSLGGKATREDLALEPAFWAQLPGNFSYRPRVSMITNRNFSALNPLHNFPSGSRDNNHWGPAVTMFPTTSGTPFYFNYHRGDLGHTTIIGPSGTGKTVVMGFLSTQSQKFKPKMCVFDKDRGTEIFVRAQGGNYTSIQLGKRTGWNPLQLELTERNKAFLKQWLKMLISINGSKVISQDTNEINTVVESIHQIEHSKRRLTTIFPLFDVTRKDGVADRLTSWIESGEYGWLFDNENDSLNNNNRVVGFDMTEILDEPDTRTPTIFYLFHRMEEMIDGSPFIGFFDEGWKLLDDEMFPPMMKDKYKTIRKKNGVLVFGSNDAADATGTAVGKVIIQQSPTKIFMPNEEAKREDYIDGWGLTEKEFKVIGSLTKESRCFLIKQGSNSVVAKLNLDGFDNEIAVLSAREETVRLLDEIRSEINDIPADWMPVFHERRKSYEV